MKMKKYIYAAAVALTIAAASCSDDFTYPPLVIPSATMQPNTNIGDLKSLYWQDDRNYCSTITPLSDGRDLIIKGRVVSSDSSGNIYKNVIIEDNSGAITVAVNANDLYKTYQYGQEVVVNCTGLQIGGYNGLMQLGSQGEYNGAPSMTFMTKEIFADHAQPDGLPAPQKVIPAIFTLDQLDAALNDPAVKREYMSRLVTVSDVSFETPGQQFAPTASTDRYVKNGDKKLNVRCSSYASFKNEIIPSGTGSVTGILSYYGSAWQLQLNDLNGLVGFTPYDPSLNPVEPAKGSGTAEDPYNVAKALEVAAANGETSDVSYYTAGYVTADLSIDTSFGNATLTIADNEDGTGSTIKVYRVKYFNNEKFTSEDQIKKGDYIVVYAPIINFKGNTPETNLGYLYSINGETGGTVTPPTPGDEEGDGNGTQANPYTVQQVIAKNPTGNDANPDEKDVWVTGYIVGWADMSSTYYINDQTARFTAPATMATNILLAPSADVKDVTKCIGIQLPSGNVRSALNLQNNPDNLGRKVSIKGNIAKYSGVAGLRGASEYAFDGETPDDPTPDDPTPGEAKGSGTEADPYNIAKAYEVCVANGETSDVEVYTAGYVISGSIDLTYGNATWVVADNKEGTGQKITFFRVKDFGGEKFTDANKVKIGDYLVVKAPLINYKGNTPETNYGTLISINGNTGATE